MASENIKARETMLKNVLPEVASPAKYGSYQGGSMHTVFSTTPSERWKVVAADNGFWRTGLYRPEFENAAAITTLEKHDCPELFVCAGGRMGLLLYDGETETVLELEPGQAVMVKDYHNGFSLSPEGYFIVNERTAFVTDYIDRATREHLHQVVTR